MLKDYYKLLGVSRNATEEEIRIAYFKLVKKNHPDRLSSDTTEWTDANSILGELNQAYSVLRNTYKRRIYDTTLGDSFQKEAQQNNNQGYQTTQAPPPPSNETRMNQNSSDNQNFPNAPNTPMPIGCYVVVCFFILLFYVEGAEALYGIMLLVTVWAFVNGSIYGSKMSEDEKKAANVLFNRVLCIFFIGGIIFLISVAFTGEKGSILSVLIRFCRALFAP